MPENLKRMELVEKRNVLEKDIFESNPKILTEDKSWRTWKSDQNIVMNEELVQHVAMGTKIVKNFVMGAKIDPKVEMDSVHIRTWTLDIIPSSSLFLAGTRSSAFAPVYGCFWKNFSHLIFMPAQFAHGNLDTTFTFPRWLVSSCATLGSTVDTCAFTVLGDDFPVFSTCWSRLGSCGRFTSCSPGDFDVFAAWRSVHCRCFDCMHGPSSLHLQSGRYIYGPFASDRHMIAVAGLLEKSFFPCLIRGGRCRGRWKSRLRGDLPHVCTINPPLEWTYTRC